MRLAHLLRNQRAEERGQSVVELAVVLPIVLLLLFAIVDMGFMFNNWQVVQNAARLGATTAISEGATPQAVVATIEQAAPMSDKGKNPAFQITLNPAPPSWPLTPGSYVSVEITYNYSFITPFMPALFGGPTYPLSSFDVERVQ